MSFPYGNYTIKAVADTVPGETNTADNTFLAGSIIVTIPGDLNGDLKVKLSDLLILANAYGTQAGRNTPGIGLQQWNENADIDSNGVVGLSDLTVLVLHYRQHFP